MLPRSWNGFHIVLVLVKIYFLFYTDYSAGYIEEPSGNVLGTGDISDETLVQLQPKDDLLKDEQTWLKSCGNDQGWFKLTNLSCKKVLSLKSESSLAVKGKIISPLN